MPTVLGIDPGISGALVLLDGASCRVRHHCFMPVMRASRSEVYVPALRATILQHSPILIAGLEDVNAGAVQGRMAAFTFGGAYYAIKTFLEVKRIPFRLVKPNEWKKHFSITKKGKDHSVVIAGQLHPEIPWDSIPKGSAHNLADACLIARYIHDTYSGDPSKLHRRDLKSE